jgi:hypothetical protein
MPGLILAGATSGYTTIQVPDGVTNTLTLPSSTAGLVGANTTLTSGRVTFASTGGLLADSANLTFDGNNLGVGATLSSWGSSVKAIENESGSLFSIGTGSLRLYQNAYYNSAGNNIYKISDFATAYIQTSGTHQWFSAVSGTAGTNANLLTAMTLDANKNLGIGVTTPLGRLALKGVGSYGTAYSSNEFQIFDPSGLNNANYGFYINQSYDTSTTGNFTLGVGDSNNHTYTLAFATAGAERMRIDRSGNVGIGVASPVATLDVGGTGAIKMPVGTTAQRPTPATGMIRYNSTIGVTEYYNGTEWLGISTLTPPSSVEYLVVAGGGGGGGNGGGGGGAGGFRTGTVAVSSSAITVTVGAGGPANSVIRGSNGQDSVFGSITSTGGGGGGSRDGTQGTGASGGSGGAGGGNNAIQAGGAGNTPSTSPSQGSNGGVNGGNDANQCGGGGGGASAVGGTGISATRGGDGGAGTSSSITGSSTFYAGGGAGGPTVNGVNGTGGVGGGGNGSVAGTANTGGGGGSGNTGGSGVVIIRYATSSAAARTITGSPTYTNTGGYHIYKWTGSGSITF